MPSHARSSDCYRTANRSLTSIVADVKVQVIIASKYSDKLRKRKSRKTECGTCVKKPPKTWIDRTRRCDRIQKRTKKAPQWGAADAEIKVPSGENTELKRSPFKAWSMSVYSHTCYAYCQGFLPCLFLPFRSIHLHFFQILSRFFHSCVGPQNKIDHTAGCRFPC